MSAPIRGRADYLELGDFNAACYQCGRKRKASELKKHWQGYWVCPEHWEPRHPQDFVKAVKDDITPPFQQPQEDEFLPQCTWAGRMGLADVGIADCAICDYVAPGWQDQGFDPTAPGALDFTFILDESELS